MTSPDVAAIFESPGHFPPHAIKSTASPQGPCRGRVLGQSFVIAVWLPTGVGHVAVRLSECLLLVGEDLQRETCVQLGIVEATPSERPVLVVLHQVVVRISGKVQGGEAQRGHRRQLQEPQVRVGGAQVGQVKVNEVVAQQEVGALGQLVQSGHRLGQAAAATGEREGYIGVRPHTGHGVDAAVVPADLQVQGQAAR